MVDFVKKNCDECGRYMKKGFRKYKNQFLCYTCYCKKIHRIEIGGYSGFTLGQAINKIYKIPPSRIISFPKVLAGKKFKITLIENE